ncbi:hypothetical protein TNCV_1032301 [Trichonephila clavipes]|nr:hypothetical protein TNCV_1032301 [Trichonephila clavipes]
MGTLLVIEPSWRLLRPFWRLADHVAAQLIYSSTKSSKIFTPKIDPCCNIPFKVKLNSHQSCQRRANQRSYLARDEVSDWLDARR